MAIATANKPVNMDSWLFWDATDFQIVSATHVRDIGSGGRVQDYFGTGVVLDADDFPIAGTLTGTTYTVAGVQQYTVTNLDRDLVDAITLWSNKDPAILSFLFSGADTFNGSTGADVLNGYNGNDTIYGNGGNDKLNGGTGNDRLLGAAGNDTIIWGVGDTVNGGAGADTLKTTIDLDLTALNDNKILNVETINLAGNNTLKLSLQDLLAFPGDDLKVLGNGADTVNFVDAQGTGVMEGAFTRYTLSGGASLLIDSDIIVI